MSFFRVTAWRSLAEHVAFSPAKGNRVLVVGRLKTNTWQTPEGELRTVFEIVAEEAAPSLRFGVTTFAKRGAGKREDAEQFHEPAAAYTS